jgi:hypothetical protein
MSEAKAPEKPSAVDELAGIRRHIAAYEQYAMGEWATTAEPITDEAEAVAELERMKRTAVPGFYDKVSR